MHAFPRYYRLLVVVKGKGVPQRNLSTCNSYIVFVIGIGGKRIGRVLKNVNQVSKLHVCVISVYNLVHRSFLLFQLFVVLVIVNYFIGKLALFTIFAIQVHGFYRQFWLVSLLISDPCASLVGRLLPALQLILADYMLAQCGE